jgi:hypothetical protein
VIRGTQDMMNTETVGVMDVELCKKFLRWLEQTEDKNRTQHLENMLTKTDELPYETLVSGLKSVGKILGEVDENLVLRITTNPVGIFQSGMLLGFCMSRASVHPDFVRMLDDLEKKTENVTPISATKGFKS